MNLHFFTLLRVEITLTWLQAANEESGEMFVKDEALFTRIFKIALSLLHCSIQVALSVFL